jgi:hypothetical protein
MPNRCRGVRSKINVEATRACTTFRGKAGWTATQVTGLGKLQPHWAAQVTESVVRAPRQQPKSDGSETSA